MELNAIIGSTVYSLNDGSLAQLLGFDGWGMAPTHILSERGPLQDGETYKGQRLDPRVARLLLGLPGSSSDNLWERRQDLLEIFAPDEDTPIIVEAVVAGITYRLDCRMLGDMAMPSQDQEGFYLKVAISLWAGDPTWYKPSQNVTIFGIAVVANEFDIPLTVPAYVGQSTIDDTRTINNGGTFKAYPEIEVVGSVNNAKIENLTTGEVLDFTGLNLGSGNKRLIDCRYGVKTVQDENGANKIADLSDDSDLATFHLIKGNNDIKVTGTNGDGSTQVYIRFYERFVGI